MIFVLYCDIISKSNEYAAMAQSVEHVIGNDEVISSILITSSKKPLTYVSGFFVLFVVLFIFFRSRARDGTKDVVEIADASEAAFHGNIGDALIGLLQKTDGMIDAMLVDEIRKIDVIPLVKNAGEIMILVSEALGNVRECDLIAVMLGDIVENLADQLLILLFSFGQRDFVQILIANSIKASLFHRD